MKTKRIGVLLAVLVLLCTTLLCACGGGGDATYEVKVVDVSGAPCSGVIVKFLQGGNQVAMQPVDATGTAKKTLPKGDYTLSLFIPTKSRPAILILQPAHCLQIRLLCS